MPEGARYGFDALQKKVWETSGRGRPEHAEKLLSVREGSWSGALCMALDPVKTAWMERTVNDRLLTGG